MHRLIHFFSYKVVSNEILLLSEAPTERLFVHLISSSLQIDIAYLVVL